MTANAGILDDYSTKEVADKITTLANPTLVYNYINKNVTTCAEVMSALVGLTELAEKYTLNSQPNPYGNMIDTLTTAFIEKKCSSK